MTILEAIKKAERLQNSIYANIAKVYIRRKGWTNLIDPVDLGWVSGEKTVTPFKESDNGYAPNKESLLSNDWELFIHYYYCTPETKNKELKPETTTISKETFLKSIEQIEKAKSCLNSLNEHIKDVKTVFEKTYGISFDCFKRNSDILIDKENKILYLFVLITLGYSNAINSCLIKVKAELDNLNVDKKTE